MRKSGDIGKERALDIITNSGRMRKIHYSCRMAIYSCTQSVSDDATAKRATGRAVAPRVDALSGASPSSHRGVSLSCTLSSRRQGPSPSTTDPLRCRPKQGVLARDKRTRHTRCGAAVPPCPPVPPCHTVHRGAMCVSWTYISVISRPRAARVQCNSTYSSHTLRGRKGGQTLWEGVREAPEVHAPLCSRGAATLHPQGLYDRVRTYTYCVGTTGGGALGASGEDRQGGFRQRVARGAGLGRGGADRGA